VQHACKQLKNTPKEALGKLLNVPLSLYILFTGHAAPECHKQTETVMTFVQSSSEKWLMMTQL
jgi:hypothetical protein